jgi:lysophospholipid acyltransferase (LPLAT)-like uncharacterized protein
VRDKALGLLLYVVIGLYRLTLRIRTVGEENRQRVIRRGQPILYALWHQRMVLSILKHPREGWATMASRSADGGVIAAFLHFWGFRVVRGSSSRGGPAALGEMVDLLGGQDPPCKGAALTCDGPRGPARKSKPGIAYLASKVGAAVVPLSSSAVRARFLDSWDRYLLPIPFTRCVVVFGEPIERAEGESEADFLGRLDAAVDAVTDEADRLTGQENAPRGRPPRVKAAA